MANNNYGNGNRSSQERNRGNEWDADEAREMGQRGEMASHHHASAAFHHETAAHHHRQAAFHREAGRHEQAELHGAAARGHGRSAGEHSQEADRHGRGFQNMDPDRQREISAMGGRASHGGGTDYNSNDERNMGDRSTGGNFRGYGRDDQDRGYPQQGRRN